MAKKASDVMGTKGESAKNRIIDVARQLFTSMGYSAVSMQDICRGTGLSRGGLYRYFSSTEEIFAEIIEQEQRIAFTSLEKARSENVKPDAMLSGFFKFRFEMLLNSDVAFDNAILEFAANSKKGRDLLVRRAENSVSILTQLIEDGCASGDFQCENPKTVAMHILWTLEGIAKHNVLLPITQEDMTSQMDVFRMLLGAQKDIEFK